MIHPSLRDMNVPPWEYQPVPPYTSLVYGENNRCLGQVHSPDAEEVAAFLATYHLPPPPGSFGFVIDATHSNPQIVFGWCCTAETNHRYEFYGVEAFYKLLEGKVENFLLLDMEFSARKVSWEN